MKFLQLPKATLVLFAILMISSVSIAQKGKHMVLGRDTVKMNTATQRISEFKETFEGRRKNKKATESVKFNIAVLREILDSLSAKNIEVIDFKFATIRPEDVATYVAQHPEQGLNEAEQKELIGRPTLLIRVPRSAMRSTSLTRGLANDMNRAALAPISDDEAVFIDLGAICPPPNSCR